ncbi:MAG: chitobiase/beta-hexosaminidase C-terminal domain-containing protein, partial [Bacteroidota bacterium]
LPVTYRERIPTMQELLRLRDEGALNEAQAQWFRTSKPSEELFDCVADPHELNNLADDPAHLERLEAMGAEMDRWLAAIGDQPNLPEEELLNQLWNGQSTQPVTTNPVISKENDKVVLSCATEGASIGYKIIGKDGTVPKGWAVYQKPLTIPTGDKIQVQAHRIGFQKSETINEQIE